MDIIESFKLVLRNMSEKKGRVFLTLLGIIIGIFTFTFFIFVSQGLSNAIAEQFNSLGTNVLGIQRIGDSGGTPTGSGLTDTELEKVKQVARNVKYVAPGIFYNARIERGEQRVFTIAISYPDEYLTEVSEDMGLEIAEGRKLRPGDSGSVVLGYKFANEAFETKLQVGSAIKINDKSLRVIGIIEEQGDLFVDSSAMINFDDMKEISGQDTYSVIRARFQDGADLDYNQEVIEQRLNPNKDKKEFVVTSSQQIIEQFNQIIGLLTAIIIFISSVALVVGGINVLNTMYSNVIERINEISIMKALGATNEDIRNLFLIESATLGIIGSFIGFGLSYLLAEVVSFFITSYYGYNVPINFDFLLFIGVILVTAFFAALFGTYPALRAAHVNPANNLKED
jgi:putative ABC transport system permease protein